MIWSRLRWRRVAIATLALVIVTLVMLAFRSRLDKAHVALMYLLVVLGGSAAEGRRVGIALGVASFISFNALFLPPYYRLTIANPLDWLVLITFLATSIVAAELLERQRRQAEIAERRAVELDRLSTLGAETLNAARAEQALSSIASVIRSALNVGECALFVHDGSALRAVDGKPGSDAPLSVIGSDSLLNFVVQSGRSAVERADMTPRAVSLDVAHDGPETFRNIGSLAMPLAVRGQTVGALRLVSARGFSLTDDQRRLLVALAYYAALGIERLRLEKSEETAEALRRADRLKDALLASVSHDLRTPLTTIKAIAHEIVQDGDAARAVIIEEEADRLARLVEGILQLSQLDAGALPMAIECNTIDDLVGAALQRAEGAIKGHAVDVDLVEWEMLVGRFDFSHALRIVVNLLENAAKYSAPGEPIRITAQRRGDRIELAVVDHGIGIDPADYERIFYPFYRAAGVPPDIRGAGLGLAIARRLADAQGGSLAVTPEPGGGSRFTLTLAAAEALPA